MIRPLEILKKRLEERNISPRQASLLIGANAGYVRDMFARNALGNMDYFQALARHLGLDMNEIVGQETVEAVPQKPAEGYAPPVQFLGKSDLPVYSAVEGGPGEIVFGDNLYETVPRPWFVANVPEAYAVLVVGESMVPVVRPGQMVIVNPRLGLIPGELAIFSSHKNGEFRATVKEFFRSTADTWQVKQYNPPDGQTQDLRLPKPDWPKAVRVVGVFAGR